MTATFQLPSGLDQRRRHDVADLDRAANEVLPVILCRQSRIPHYTRTQPLGLDRFETQAVLHWHNLTGDVGTVMEHLDEVQAVEELRSIT